MSFLKFNNGNIAYNINVNNIIAITSKKENNTYLVEIELNTLLSINEINKQKYYDYDSIKLVFENEIDYLSILDKINNL